MTEEAIVYTGPNPAPNAGAPTGAPGRARTPVALHDQDFWFFRNFPLRLVIPVLLLAALAGWIAMAFKLPWYYCVPIGVVVVPIALAPVRRRHPRSIAAMIAGAMAFRLNKWQHDPSKEPPEAFDVPLPEGGSYGVRWDDDRLITMLRIEPPPDSMTWLRPGSLGSRQDLQLSEIASCLGQFDITLDSIDIVSTGARTASNGAVAWLYDRILGPLPAIGRRTVWLVLRLDPLANAEAVDNRGGGGTGALRAAIIATRRVSNRLAARNITVSVLTASEINSAVRQLTHGISPDQFKESPDTLEYQGLHLTSYAIGRDLIASPGFADLWAAPSLSTTITVRLRPMPSRAGREENGQPTISLHALVRFDTIREPAEAPVPGLRRLPGQQLRALLDSLPIATPRGDTPDDHRGPLDALNGLVVPTAGCGQLIGADPTGRGIAVPLIGEGTRHLEVIGKLDLAQQVVLRAIALGAHTVVHTMRPDAWNTMVTNVGAPGSLSLAPRSAGASHHPPLPAVQPGSPYPTTTVVVFDGITPTALPGGATILHVRDENGPESPFDPDVTLSQDPSQPNMITVRTATDAATVQMVTTPDEMQYIGESLVMR
ncbi:type VII secretion protein EccE [Nocardia sp. NEAU-G5]|uniref:Type VII secretion protein EccE n=1 Tax=Nocardia albiluteola TaxID=2842303 RepID=A0ABS6BFG5_9NOCA|nr:type VII secretion protein EccE [Nocardia albiluteola]MBU3067993.1 type VII secretion protein EccE [Nocardia albiluteola]